MPVTIDGTTGVDTPIIKAGNIVGEVSFFAMVTPPTGWLKANGSAVSRTTYADLFAVVGTSYGAGDGSTTFNLPDLRGEFVRGFDDSRGVDSGRTMGSAQVDAFGAHKHIQGYAATVSSRYGNQTGLSTQNSDQTSGATGSSGAFTSTEGSTETRPRNVALLACIKF